MKAEGKIKHVLGINTQIRRQKLFLLYNCFHKMENDMVCLVVFHATFNNISVISWRSVLLVDETGGPGENHQPVASH